MCYVSTLKAHRDKFSPWAKAAVFIGYPFGLKGYKLLDIETISVIISRNIVFHESIFPFYKENQDIVSFSEPFHDTIFPRIVYDIETSSASPTRSLFDVVVPSLASPTRPLRTSKEPDYLKDYHCSLINSVEHIESNSTAHPIQPDYLKDYHFLSHILIITEKLL